MDHPVRDQWDCFAPFEADADIAGPGIITSFLLTAWVTCFVACIQLYCVLSAKFRLVLLDSVDGTTVEDVGKYTVKITSFSVPMSLQNGFPRVVKLLHLSLHASRCVLAMLLSLFRDDQPRLQLFSQMALDRLCDLQLVTGTAILIAGIVQLKEMTFYHQSLITSYWLLTLNAFWAARAGYLNSKHYDNDRSFYFWTRWTAILISDILSIYYQLVTTLEAANEWDTEVPGHCYRSHEPSPTDSQYFWIAGITFEVLYMIFYTIGRIAQSLADRRPRLKMLLNSIEQESNGLINGSRQGISDLENRSKLWAINFWFPLRMLITLLRVTIIALGWFTWQVLALWAWGDSASVALVLGYIGLAAWNSFDVIDTKLSNRDLVVGDESTWSFGQILPLGLLALIALDLLDIVNKAYRHQRTRNETVLWPQNDGLQISISDKGKDSNETDLPTHGQTSTSHFYAQ